MNIFVFVISSILSVSLANTHGTTVFEFSRRFDTCDAEADIPLADGTTRMVWAYHENDPIDDAVPYHTARGSTSLRLFEDRAPVPIESDASVVDLRVEEHVVDFYPGSDTTYWCKAFKTELDPVHMVKSEPIITDGNLGIVHHILLYLCQGELTEEELNTEGHCYSNSMPANIQECNGDIPVVAWAVGGEAYYFPEHVGFPLGGTQYFVMETHYDNPNFLRVVDGSGVRLTVTPTKRQYDAGILNTGWATTSAHQIPAGQEAHEWEGWCPGQLTAELLEGSSFVDPDTGEPYVKILSTLLHAHTAGAAISLRHIRDGTELPVIAEDMHYDFNFQDFINFREEIVVKAGDDLVTTCWYDTRSRTQPTPFGLSSTEEMCLAYTVYYPATADVPTCHYHVPNWASAGTGGQVQVTADMKVIDTPLPAVPCERVEPEDTTPVLRDFAEFDPERFTNHAILDAGYTDEGRYELYWSVDHASSEIHFAVQVQTDGWVGLGFSPTGGMVGADMMIGWVTEDGDVRFKDRYATAKAEPPVDALQDFFRISGYYSDEPANQPNEPVDGGGGGGTAYMIGGIALGSALTMGGLCACAYYRRSKAQTYSALSG